MFVEVELVIVPLVAVKLVKAEVKAVSRDEKRLVEVELVIVPLVAIKFVFVKLLIVALSELRLVMVEEAAVVVAKEVVAEKLAG
jgi:hypothetical protein